MSKLSSAIRLAIPARFRPIGFLTHLVEQRTGRRVRAGPFVGMNYANRSCSSAYLPKLLGTVRAGVALVRGKHLLHEAWADSERGRSRRLLRYWTRPAQSTSAGDRV